MQTVLEKLGIAEAMKPKLKPQANPAGIVSAVANGDAQYGVFLTHVLSAPGLEPPVPFPAELNSELVLVGAVAAASKESAAAQAFLDYLKTPEAAAVFRSKGVTPTMLGVNPSIPATDIKSLIALVKQNPGKYTYGSSGLGSILHLCGEQFKALAGGLDIQHVPYRGSNPMMSDLVAGQITMAFDATPTAMQQAQSGGIRAVGAGMAERIRAMPELPTLQEQGLKGFECYTWNAILAPAGTPQPVIDKLAAAIKTALDDPAVFKRLEEAGVEPTLGRGPKETAAFIAAELAKWAPIIKMSGAVIN